VPIFFYNLVQHLVAGTVHESQGESLQIRSLEGAMIMISVSNWLFWALFVCGIRGR